MIHRRRLLIVLAAAVVVVVAASGVLVRCGLASRAWTHTATVRPSGGRVGADDAPAQLDVPAGAAGKDTKIVFTGGKPKTTATLDEIALPVGDAVNIKPAAALPGAKVRMPFDPKADLPGRATVTNAFIAVYNEGLHAWVPLPTTYDEAGRHLVAEAPHFTWFRRYVVNPAKWLGDVTGVTAAARWAVEQAANVVKGVGGALWEMVNGEQQEIECPSPPNDWTVRTSVSEVTGCVVPGAAASDPATLRLRSTLRLPFEVVLPSTVTASNASGYDADLDAIDTSARWLAAALGRAFVPARGRTEVTVPAAATAPGSSVTVRFEPAQLALALRAVVTMLNFVPGTAKFVEELFARATVRQRMVELAANRVSVTEYFAELRVVIRREIEVSQKSAPLTYGPVLLDAWECVASAVGSRSDATADGGASTESVVATAMSLAKKCLNTAIEAYNRVNRDAIKEVVAVVAAFPEGIQLLGTLWDSVRLGLTHFGGQFEVTATRGVPTQQSDLAGEQYAFVKSVDPAARTVTFDLVDWFWRPDALAACRADGVAVQDNAWCNEYHYRNNNPALRTVTVSSGATILGVSTEPSLREVPLTLDQLRTWPTFPDRPFKLQFAGGVITRMAEVFTP